jgi:HEPN domain-containing protein
MSAQADANIEEARRWLRQAEENLGTARWNGQGQLWAPACFYCQQAGEIALKALLIRQGERVLRTHSVLLLAERAAAYEPAFSKLAEGTRRLDRYYIATRYPNGMTGGTASQNFDERDFREAESTADEILHLVQQHVPAA